MIPEQEPVYSGEAEKASYLVDFEAIPHELHDIRQWVCWRYVFRGQGKKPDKQPVNPNNLRNAGVHWANTWSTGDVAFTTYLDNRGRGIDGIGFVLTKEDPFVGIDIDNCLAEVGISETAQQVLQQIHSYTEISPSGYGLRMLLEAPEFSTNARTQELEIYSHSRFLTLTGHHLPGTPTNITPIQTDAFQVLLPERSPQELSPSQTPISEGNRPVDDEMLWERIFRHDHYGQAHLRRFGGDTALDRGDHSLTVIRLLNCLARWTECDPTKMRTMILMSPLANEKWFSKRGNGDWLAYQIADAISYVSRKNN